MHTTNKHDWNLQIVEEMYVPVLPGPHDIEGAALDVVLYALGRWRTHLYDARSSKLSEKLVRFHQRLRQTGAEGWELTILEEVYCEELLTQTKPGSE